MTSTVIDGLHQDGSSGTSGINFLFDWFLNYSFYYVHGPMLIFLSKFFADMALVNVPLS